MLRNVGPSVKQKIPNLCAKLGKQNSVEVVAPFLSPFLLFFFVHCVFRDNWIEEHFQNRHFGKLCHYLYNAGRIKNHTKWLYSFFERLVCDRSEWSINTNGAEEEKWIEKWKRQVLLWQCKLILYGRQNQQAAHFGGGVVIAIFHLLRLVARACMRKRSKSFRKQFNEIINNDQINNFSCRCVYVCVYVLYHIKFIVCCRLCK